MKRFRQFNQLARICVVGVGGGGNNAVNRMIEDRVKGIDFIAVNTETLSLLLSKAPTNIQIGASGQGAGGVPENGRRAAERARKELRQALTGADMVFVTAGMGGGTGTGAAPVIADIAREVGAVTIGVVTTPFAFEIGKRHSNAKRGIAELKQHVDTLITIPNQRLLHVAGAKVAMREAFRRADTVLKQAIEGITEIITSAGTINVDFADVKAVMSGGGEAVMAIGCGSGEKASVEAANMALDSSLLGISVDGAKAVLLNFQAGRNFSIQDLNDSAEIIRQRAHPDANIIFGYRQNDALGDDVRLTLIATGVDTTLREENFAAVQKHIARKAQPVEPKTRRVYLSQPIRKQPKRERVAVTASASTTRQTESVPTFLEERPRFQANQWGIPAYLRG